MCGIAGIVAYREGAPRIDSQALLRIREAMAVRGPDGAGIWVSGDARAGLAHRRLAIIDLSETGAQPMSAGDGRLHITFNGEIYNYRELRKELIAKGYRFRSTSDTEVLLNLYLECGAAMVEVLRGMYTFAIWDESEKRLFLARDPFGIKPLYYADDGKTVRFASQVKALLAGGQVSDAPSPAGHVGFYLWGHVPDPHTLYRSIRAVPAGTTITIDRNGVQAPKRFFSIAEEFAQALEPDLRMSRRETDEIVHAALKDSVRHHLIADVPVGVFLSSGVDSTTVTALAAEAEGSKLHTVTLGFNEYRGTANDETRLAELVAQRYGTHHETRWVSKSEFDTELPKILHAMDQPSIDGVNTYFVSRAAAASGMKVALSGIGGDELFGGSPSFRDLPQMVRVLGFARWVPGLGRAFRKVSAPLLKHLTSPKYASLLEYGDTMGGAYLLRRGLFMPWELPDLLDAELVREGWNELQTLLRLDETIKGIDSDFQRVAALELSWYMQNQLLRDSDWAGMAHSLEIRVPFVDVALFRAVAPLMVREPMNKIRMAQAPEKQLPLAILEKRKTGFSIPVRDWYQQVAPPGPLRRGLRTWAQRVIPDLQKPLRILVLATDAFGGYGGIAKFNRDLLTALCSHPGCREVVAIPRVMTTEAGPLPPKLTYLTGALDNKLKYISSVLKTVMGRGRYDLIICGHINLLPIAWLASLWSRARLVLVIHGIDAWNPTHNPFTNWLARRIDAFISVSTLTKGRFLAWSGLKPSKGLLLPNSIDFSLFKPGSKSPELVSRYGLDGKTVIMTMGRLVSAERYKGFDEVLEQMPAIITRVPNIVYMIVGDGNDRARLEEKALSLGVRDQVVFTGFVPEGEKRDHYNLAEAFIMPSRGEGFGIVFLEAMACGVPVVGSSADGSREALRDGTLGTLVDPNNPLAIQNAILDALSQPRRVQSGLEYFGVANFERRVHEILNQWSAA